MSRLTASQRLQRLLSLIPWVAEHDGPTVDEVCARFEMRPSELLEELSLVALVGVPPYTPDELFETVVEDGRVFVHLSPSFDRPLRLTFAEALSLVAAGASIRSVAGHDPDGPLERGLGKLASTLGIRAEDALDVDLGIVAGGPADDLRTAIAGHRRVRLDYYVHGRDEHTVREVDPYRLWVEEGQWYLVGYDHLRGDERIFRVDRITALEVLDDVFAEPDEEPSQSLFNPSDGDPRVVVEVGPEHAWVTEAYPVEAAEATGDGRVRLTIAVAARPWLARLLLRLGADARVVDDGGAADFAAAGEDAARRVRARYA